MTITRPPRFHRAHYEFLAAWAGPNLSRRATTSLADALAQDNPSFDPRKFLDTYTRVRAAAGSAAALAQLASLDYSQGERLANHKAANLNRGIWENHTCWKCDDGRNPDKCPVACMGGCEYPRAIND